MTGRTGGEIDLNSIIDMIGSMASLDFSKRLDVEINNDPINVIAYGLNMLSEELELNMVKKSLLEEVNENLERFSFTVAHDIRSPLNSAAGLIELMEMDLDEQQYDSLRENLWLLKKVYARTNNMVNGILEYSRTNFNSLKTAEIDLNVFLGDLAQELHFKYPVNISYMPGMPVVHYNEQALEQIFRNLVGNAIKYNDKEVCTLDFGYEDKGAYYEIFIKDNGPGIEAAHLDRVFDLFESFKTGNEDSFGIGLSIVKKLVTQAGGDIRVESVPGQGATFIFTILKKTDKL